MAIYIKLFLAQTKKIEVSSSKNTGMQLCWAKISVSFFLARASYKRGPYDRYI